MLDPTDPVRINRRSAQLPVATGDCQRGAPCPMAQQSDALLPSPRERRRSRGSRPALGVAPWQPNATSSDRRPDFGRRSMERGSASNKVRWSRSCLMGLIVAFVLAAPLVSDWAEYGYEANTTDAISCKAPFSDDHLLGTDPVGRDVLGPPGIRWQDLAARGRAGRDRSLWQSARRSERWRATSADSSTRS